MQITESKIIDQYRRRTPTSEALAAEARLVFPSGVTHDSRYLEPYPIFVERAAGSRKWDADGNEYVDYTGGHGALLLGHNHPRVNAAVEAQLALGTHFGSCHLAEIKWGQIVQRLVPSAERVRFTSSGTEATLLALRIARASTGKPKVVRFMTNFHGWHDHVAFGVGSHLDGTPTPGVLEELAANVLLTPPGDLGALQEVLAAHDDIAAVMLEPTGASWGQIPISEEFLRGVRELTAESGVVLLFDEVITGFRCSPGGAQGYYGVTPDLTTLAKILAGGLPGGALVGRRDLLDWLDHRASRELQREKIPHQGTFNANPLSAAAGTAALEMVGSQQVCERANDFAARLRDRLNRVLVDERVPWCVYGTFSGFHIYTNPERDEVTPAQIDSCLYDWRKIKQATASPVVSRLRLGMLLHGVEIFSWPGGPTSAAHNDDDLERTEQAFRATLALLKEDGSL